MSAILPFFYVKYHLILMIFTIWDLYIIHLSYIYLLFIHLPFFSFLYSMYLSPLYQSSLMCPSQCFFFSWATWVRCGVHDLIKKEAKRSLCSTLTPSLSVLSDHFHLSLMYHNKNFCNNKKYVFLIPHWAFSQFSMQLLLLSLISFLQLTLWYEHHIPENA